VRATCSTAHRSGFISAVRDRCAATSRVGAARPRQRSLCQQLNIRRILHRGELSPVRAGRNDVLRRPELRVGKRWVQTRWIDALLEVLRGFDEQPPHADDCLEASSKIEFMYRNAGVSKITLTVKAPVTTSTQTSPQNE
jgi:hypothetical protein